MSYQAEINKMILRKIETAEVEENVRQFLFQVLRYENRVANRANVRYRDDYLKLIQEYSKASLGEDEG